MANVFGGGSSSSQSGGISKVIPTARDAVSTSSQPTFSSQTNVFGAPTSIGTEGVDLRDFYTKSEVQRLLRTKSDVSSSATKEELDVAVISLEQKIQEDTIHFVNDNDVDLKISSSFENVLDYLASNYIEGRYLYSKSEVDEKFNEIDLNEADLLKRSPDTTLENTIDPQSKFAIALTIKGSSHPEIFSIQEWVDYEDNTVGRVRSDGRVDFYGSMFLGNKIETWRPALDVNERRISGVADPIHKLDAVNKKYMEDTVAQVVDDVIREGDLIFTIDCQEY